MKASGIDVKAMTNLENYKDVIFSDALE